MKKTFLVTIITPVTLFILSGCIMNAFSYTHTTIEEMTEHEYKTFKKDFISFAQTINYLVKILVVIIFMIMVILILRVRMI